MNRKPLNKHPYLGNKATRMEGNKSLSGIKQYYQSSFLMLSHGTLDYWLPLLKSCMYKQITFVTLEWLFSSSAA